MPIVIYLLGFLLLIISCCGLLALSNGLIVPHHTELPAQEAEEEAQ
jgi:hypothetical protein